MGILLEFLLCRRRRLVCGLVLLSFALPPAFTQVTEVIITAVEYHITGRTREFALRSVLDVEPGLTFSSMAELEDFLADQNQLLINQRPLADSAVEYRVEELTDGRMLVRVDVYTVDSWNIIAVPFARYNSDDGLQLSLRGRDYNAMGTLERVAFDIDWNPDYPAGGLFDTDRFDVFMRWTVPFEWQGYEWRWGFGASLALIDGAENQYALSNQFGMTFPWIWNLDWTVSYLQDLDFRGGNADDRYWLTSGARLETSVETPWQLPLVGVVDYEPAVTLRQPYSTERLSPQRRGTELAFAHRLVAGRVDWIENFRRGTRASVSNRNAVNFYRVFDGTENEHMNPVDSIVDAELAGYGAYRQGSRVPLGVSARIGSFIQPARFADQPTAISTRVRGIRRRVDGEEQLRGEYGGYANVDFAARVFRIPQFAEGQLGVFLDIGAAQRFAAGGLEPEDFQFGAGIELVGFPLFSRALYMRASLGFDLRAVVEDETARSGRREIFIGLDHHY